MKNLEDVFREVITTNQQYQLVSEIGKGSFGVVCLARDAVDGGLVAIKIIKRQAITKYVEVRPPARLAWHA
jgi:serine/threonine protein kinase